MPSPRFLRFTLFSVLLIAMAAPAMADMDDYQFALGLLKKWKWADLSEEVARELERDPNQPEEVRANAAFLLCDILKARANAANNEAKRNELLKAYEEALRDAQKKYAGSGRAGFVDLEIVKGIMTRGQQAAARVADAANDADRQAARRESSEAYEEAVEKLAGIVADFDARIAKIQEEEPKSLYDPNDPKYAENGEVQKKCDFAHLMSGDAHFEWAETLEDSDSKKAELYQKAEAAYQDTYDNHSTYQKMEVEGGIGWGKALGTRAVLQGDEKLMAQALEICEAMTYVEPRTPLDQIDPQYREEVKNFILDAKAQAFYWTARLYIRLAEKKQDPSLYEKSFQVVEKLLKSYPDAADRHFGKKAIMEMGKGMIRGGDAGRGATALVELIRRGKKGANVNPHWGVDPYGSEACKALSEGYLAAPFAVSAESGYYTGLGFLFRQMPLEAVNALRHGLAAAEVWEEDRDKPSVQNDAVGSIPAASSNREELRPLILWELGQACNLLVGGGEEGKADTEPYYRYDAAIAYFQIYVDHPDFARLGDSRFTAQTAGDLAVSLVKPLADAGDEAAVEYSRTMRSYMAEQAQQRGDTGGGAIIFMYDTAAEYQAKGQFKTAAEEFLRIPEQINVQGVMKAAPRYLMSRVMAGYCKAMAFRKGQADENYGQEGIELLRETAQKAQAANDANAWSAVVYYLGANVLTDGGDVPSEEGLMVLAAFDEHQQLATNTTFAPLVRQRQVDGYIAAGRIDEALAVYEKLAASFASHAARKVAAYVLGDKLSSHPREGMEEQDRAKAAEILGWWWTSEDRSSAPMGNVFWMAQVYLKGGRPDLAAPLFKKVTGRLEGKDPQDLTEEDKQLLVFVQVSEAEALLDAKKYAQAVEAYRKLREQYPDDVGVIKGLAYALIAWYRKDPAGQTNPVLLEALKAWNDFYERVAGAVAAAEREGETPARDILWEFWNARATIIELNLLLKDWSAVEREMRMMERLGDLEEHPFPEILKKLMDLRERAREQRGK